MWFYVVTVEVGREPQTFHGEIVQDHSITNARDLYYGVMDEVYKEVCRNVLNIYSPNNESIRKAVAMVGAVLAYHVQPYDLPTEEN